MGLDGLGAKVRGWAGASRARRGEDDPHESDQLQRSSPRCISTLRRISPASLQSDRQRVRLTDYSYSHTQPRPPPPNPP